MRVEIVIDKDYLSPDDTKRAFELEQKDIDQMDYEEIPLDDIKKIKASIKLHKGNDNPSESDIFEIYIERLNQRLGNGI